MNRILASLLLLSLLSPAASADEPRSPEILAAESDGALALAQDGMLDEAVTIWLNILDELPPKARGYVHVNLAVAYKALGQLPEAWYHLDAVLKQAEKKNPDIVAERAAVEKQLAKTHIPQRISCDAPGTMVFLTLEKNQPYPCPLRWWFLKGAETRIFAVAPEHEASDTQIKAHELDQDRQVAIHLKPLEKPVVPDVPIVKTPPRAKGQAWKWSLFGGGMGLVGTAIILQVVAFNKDQDLRKKWDPLGAETRGGFGVNVGGYNQDFNRDVRPLARGAYALYGIGGAAAAAGMTFLISDWSRPKAESSIHLAPLMAPGVGGLALDLGF